MKRTSFAMALALTMGALAASSAQAQVVTVGSPLSATFNQVQPGSPVTFANTAISPSESGTTATSPVDGTVIRWRVFAATGGPFTLVVLHPAGGTPPAFTAAAVSSPQTPANSGIQTFPTNLPIHAGDLVGLNNSTNTDKVGLASPVNGSAFDYWQPGLANGATASPSFNAQNEEAAVNADVEPAPPAPSHTSITKAQIKRRAHKATFSFTGTGATSFQCELIRPKRKGHRRPKATFAPCSSPKAYKHLKPGRYTFEVQGINSSGMDPSPAIQKFRI